MKNSEKRGKLSLAMQKIDFSDSTWWQSPVCCIAAAWGPPKRLQSVKQRETAKIQGFWRFWGKTGTFRVPLLACTPQVLEALSPDSGGVMWPTGYHRPAKSVELSIGTVYMAFGAKIKIWEQSAKIFCTIFQKTSLYVPNFKNLLYRSIWVYSFLKNKNPFTELGDPSVQSRRS